MNRILLLLLLLSTTTQTYASVPYNQWWEKANHLYENKSYDSAVFYYEKLTAQHPENALIYFNLGNSYYRMNEIGNAVLNYERALKIRPGFKEAQDNLELTQSRIPNRIQSSQDIFFIGWWKSLTSVRMAEVWALITLVLFLVTLAIFVLRRWNRSPGWMRPQVTLATSLLCICALFLAYVSAKRKTTHNHAVVMEQNAAMRENIKSTKAQTLIPEGTVLKIESEDANWAQVKLPNGRNGWIEKSALARI